jgi:hypothetical protein
MERIGKLGGLEPGYVFVTYTIDIIVGDQTKDF